MKHQIVLLLVAISAVAAIYEGPDAPTRPVIPETYEGFGEATFHNHTHTFHGVGHMAHEPAKGWSLERWHFPAHQHRDEVLGRYDLGKEYFIFERHGHHSCHSRAITPPPPSHWGWVKDAVFAGARVYRNRTYDEWQWKSGGVTLNVWVHDTHVNRPVFFQRISTAGNFSVFYIAFDARAANASEFVVPRVCANVTEEIEDIKYVPTVNAPTRPVIPETYEGFGESTFHNHTHTFHGTGHMAHEPAKGWSLERWHFPAHQFRDEVLGRYDLGKEYFIFERHGHHSCHSRAITPPPPSHWGWVKDAVFAGARVFRNRTYDEWQWKSGGVTLNVWVHDTNVNRPVFFQRIASNGNFSVFYIHFEARAANASEFVVPRVCANATSSVIEAEATPEVNAPTRPVIPETYEGFGESTFHNHTHTFHGTGHMAHEPAKGWSLERWHFPAHQFRDEVLGRYDLGKEYFIFERHGHHSCHSRAITPPPPSHWGWVKDAVFAGARVFRNRTYDEWQWKSGGITLNVWVHDTNVNRPVFFQRIAATGNFSVFYIHFEARAANASEFVVPRVCANVTEEVEDIKYVPTVNAPTRPVIPETYEGFGEATFHNHTHIFHGTGHMAHEPAKGWSLERWHFPAHQHRDEVLGRYDLGKEYFIFERHGHHSCHSRAITPPPPSHWGWVKDAVFAGARVFRNRTYDEWQWKSGGVTLNVWVHDTHVNRPVFFQRISTAGNFSVFYIAFEARAANASEFVVPRVCANATSSMVTEKQSPMVILGGAEGVCQKAVDTATAVAKQNCRYSFGGIGPCSSGFDNDGMVSQAFALSGKWIPRDVVEQQRAGTECTGGIQAGDLLFVGSPAYHVAMSIGNGMVAECPITHGECRVASIDEVVFTGGCRRYC